MMKTNFDREKEWWNSKADSEEQDRADEVKSQIAQMA